MAVSDILKNNAASAAAPAAAPAAATTGTKKAKGEGRVAAFRQSGEALVETYTEDQKAIKGSKSATLTFVAVAQDPQVKQPRAVAGGASEASHKTVGFIFRSSEDITVPFCPMKVGATYPTDVEELTHRQVKAGEEFVLGNVEMGMLLSQLEYSGCACGEGGKTVTLSAAASKSNPDEFLPILKTEQGSIKENPVMIADEVKGEDGKSTFKLKPMFVDEFSGYYTKRTAAPKAASKKKDAQSCDAMAAAFRAMYAAKAAK